MLRDHIRRCTADLMCVCVRACVRACASLRACACVFVRARVCKFAHVFDRVVEGLNGQDSFWMQGGCGTA
jgi:hypothetical protein